jgi:hypothetical protein
MLSALPPDYTFERPGCGFSDYPALLAHWIGALAGLSGVNVVFQLHPAVSDAQARHIESLGARIARQDIAALIPLCDTLVTSVSSIIRFAIVCGTPVLNYDVYRFGYADYAAAGGVLTVSAPDAFQHAAVRLATDGAFHAELARKQRSCAPEWGSLDGAAGARMIALFDELTT